MIIWTVILTWCGSKENFEFEFEWFYWYFYTENSFEELNQELTGFAHDLLSNKIIKLYQQTNNSWYTDSIIILKQSTPKDLAVFVQENQDKMKLEWYSFDNPSNHNTRCNEQKLDSITNTSTLNWNLNKIYFSQTYIKNKNHIYIISFSSEQEDERNTFESDIKNIKCR